MLSKHLGGKKCLKWSTGFAGGLTVYPFYFCGGKRVEVASGNSTMSTHFSKTLLLSISKARMDKPKRLGYF